MSIDRTESMQLRRYRPAVAKARTYARELADRWSLPALRDDLELAVSEVVTNAVVHGDAAEGSRVTVSYRLTDDRLRVEVRDRATGTPGITRRWPPEIGLSTDDLAEDGHGLPVLTAITDRWGVTPQVIGKSVWFEFERPRAYGYMRAYDATPDELIRADEQRLRSWARAEGYALIALYQEVVAGGVTELTALIEEMKRTGVRTVVVPSVEHLGSGRFLREHVWAEIVGRADGDVREAVEAVEALGALGALGAEEESPL